MKRLLLFILCSFLVIFEAWISWTTPVYAVVFLIATTITCILIDQQVILKTKSLNLHKNITASILLLNFLNGLICFINDKFLPSIQNIFINGQIVSVETQDESGYSAYIPKFIPVNPLSIDTMKTISFVIIVLFITGIYINAKIAQTFSDKIRLNDPNSYKKIAFEPNFRNKYN